MSTLRRDPVMTTATAIDYCTGRKPWLTYRAYEIRTIRSKYLQRMCARRFNLKNMLESIASLTPQRFHGGNMIEARNPYANESDWPMFNWYIV